MSTIDKNTRVNIVYDNCFEPTGTLYSGQSQYWFDYAKNDKRQGNIDIVKCGTEASSFLATLDIIMARNLPDETIVYIVEDDYLHRPNWCAVLREAFALPVDYVSLYDHADKYQYYPDLRSKLMVTPSVHWRATPSTCNTYACKARTLREDIDTHRFFSRNHNGGVSQDHNKFVELERLGRQYRAFLRIAWRVYSRRWWIGVRFRL